MKVKVHLHPRQNNAKPKDAYCLSTEISKYKVEMTIKELADRVGNKGQTFLPAIVKERRKKDCFVEQQVYALDFDNTISKEEFMKRAYEYEVMPAFMYETFSCEDGKDKFRAVYVNDVVVHDLNASEIILALLRLIYPEADVQCSDAVHLYYGGKKLFYLEEKNIINIFDLAISAQAYAQQSDYKNYSRKINRFAKDYNISINENILGIHNRVKSLQIEEFRKSSSIIMESDQNSSILYVIERYNSITLMSKPKQKNKLVTGIEENQLLAGCRLCTDFYEEELEHAQKFLIATNLLQLKGGKKLFFNGVIEREAKWKKDWDYMRTQEYHAERCSKEVCPYYEQCKAYSIIDKITSNIARLKEYPYIPLEEASELLSMILEKSIYDEMKDIDIIVAQTALGKSSAYCNLIAHDKESKFMISVPTNKLQREIARDLRNKGISVYTTPNIKELTENIELQDLCSEIKDLYNKGYGLKVKETVRRYYKEHENELSDGQKYALKDYFDMKKNIEESQCVVTTHAMLLGLDTALLQQFNIIVDEDILMTIFKNTQSITFDDLIMATKNRNLDEIYCNSIFNLMGEKHGSVLRRTLPKLENSDIGRISQMEINMDGSIVDFLNADTYYVDKDKRMISYFVSKKIPDVKLTIVSATASEELYKKYCIGRNIRVYEIPNVRYMGNLYQHTGYSMSRYCIKNTGFEEIIESAFSIYGSRDVNYITFKECDTTKEIYYGKTEGYNEYKGKDLLLIGTPHNPPFVYKLLGTYLGYDASKNMQNMYVEYKEFRFKIMTYKDEDLRRLQFYFIESELEQAVGRARLLRFPCEVHLFSNFPLRQSILLQDKFMEEKEASVSEDTPAFKE